MQGELNATNALTRFNQPAIDTYLIIVYTRFSGATNTKGSRIIAHSANRSSKKVEHNYLHEYGGTENHLTAAFKFMGKHYGDADRHNFELIGTSENPTGSGMAFVFKRVGV
jgi:hypothetical protein